MTTRDSTTLAKIATMMRDLDFCMLTTRATEGGLHSRPMSNNGEVEFDGDAWFFTWRDSPKVKELAKDRRVQLSYTGGTKTKPVWIAVTGTGKIVDDEATKNELWLDELARWFEDGPSDPDVVLIKVDAKHAQWWSFEDEGELDL